MQNFLPGADLDCYLCGPENFMQAMFGYLIDLGIGENQIYYEFFGDAKKLGTTVPTLTTDSYKVKFTKSNIEKDWNYESISILELAESIGLRPNYGCRMGDCEACEVELLNGSVNYDPEPFAELKEGKVLICCAKPLTDIEVDL